MFRISKTGYVTIVVKVLKSGFISVVEQNGLNHNSIRSVNQLIKTYHVLLDFSLQNKTQRYCS